MNLSRQCLIISLNFHLMACAGTQAGQAFTPRHAPPNFHVSTEDRTHEDNLQRALDYSIRCEEADDALMMKYRQLNMVFNDGDVHSSTVGVRTQEK
jgi:hypothetical protein